MSSVKSVDKDQPDMKLLDAKFLAEMHERAVKSERKRVHYDLRTTPDDQSQRMLNILELGTEMPIHRHEDTTETVICIEGRLLEICYEETAEGFREIAREELCPREGRYGVQVPQGVWHTLKVLEPSVVFAAKDGAWKPR